MGRNGKWSLTIFPAIQPFNSSKWLNADRTWWKELKRFNPIAITGGTMMSCWGDPTDPTTPLSEQVGGDCNDEDGRTHRDNPEGPGDLVGLFLDGTMADCSTCLDGIDNNCDGSLGDAFDTLSVLSSRRNHDKFNKHQEKMCDSRFENDILKQALCVLCDNLFKIIIEPIIIKHFNYTSVLLAVY